MEQLKKLRLERGWTQKDLGDKFKKVKAPEVISRWETGKKTPSATHLVELSQIFSVSINDLLIDKSRNMNEVS